MKTFIKKFSSALFESSVKPDLTAGKRGKIRDSILLLFRNSESLSEKEITEHLNKINNERGTSVSFSWIKGNTDLFEFQVSENTSEILINLTPKGKSLMAKLLEFSGIGIPADVAKAAQANQPDEDELEKYYSGIQSDWDENEDEEWDDEGEICVKEDSYDEENAEEIDEETENTGVDDPEGEDERKINGDMDPNPDLDFTSDRDDPELLNGDLDFSFEDPDAEPDEDDGIEDDDEDGDFLEI